MGGHIFFHVKENKNTFVRNRTPIAEAKGTLGVGRKPFF